MANARQLETRVIPSKPSTPQHPVTVPSAFSALRQYSHVRRSGSASGASLPATTLQ